MKTKYCVTARLAAALLICAACATAQSKTPCTSFTVVSQDTLNNVKQGLSADDVKWFQKEIAKKYPGVCYAAPSPSVPVVFFITVTPDVYHGTRVVDQTSTQSTPITGTVTDQDGNTSQVDATAETTTTSSTAVPYSVDYGIFTLAVERRGSDGKFEVAQRFQQKGLYNTLYGIPLGGRGHHPAHAVIEDAVKWVSAGGLTDPNQSASQPADSTEK
jgi:glucose/arabinose dehydrogenase